jgi:hypothetical protein
LPVFIGDQPPDDVETAYGLTCGIMLGAATGLISQRLLWPSTAMQMFTGRAATQLDLCLRALAERESGGEGAEGAGVAAGLVSAYAPQLTQLGRLHAQAHVEPVERALDDARRAALLVLIQDLFDASLHLHRLPAGTDDVTSVEPEITHAPLREALNREREALVASLHTAAECLRDAAATSRSGLASARDAVEAILEELRTHSDLHPTLDTQQREAFVIQLSDRRRLVDRQLAIEAWLEDWRRACEIESASAVGRTDDIAYRSSL